MSNLDHYAKWCIEQKSRLSPEMVDTASDQGFSRITQSLDSFLTENKTWFKRSELGWSGDINQRLVTLVRVKVVTESRGRTGGGFYYKMNPYTKPWVAFAKECQRKVSDTHE